MYKAKLLFDTILQPEGIFNLFDIMPCGVSIALDPSCRTIIHNAIAAQFLRISKWDTLSHSAELPPAVEVWSEGRKLRPEELPIQRAAWKCETVSGVELEFIWPDGERKIGLWSARPLYKDGTVCSVLAVCEDITSNKRLERELISHRDNLCHLVEEMAAGLQRSERQFRTLVESIPMAIGRFDKDRRFLYLSPQAERAFGLSHEQCHEKTWRDLGIATTAALKLDAVLGQALKTGLAAEYEMEYTNQEKALRWYRIQVIPERTASGQPETVLVIAEDITEKKRQEQELLRLDRLNIVGELAASIGHEVRNPLTTIRGYLQLIQRKAVAAEYHQHFDTMIEELDRAGFIISEFLSLAKNKASNLQPGNLNQVIVKIMPLIEADALSRNHIIQTRMNTIPDLYFDDKEIRQLLLNLTRNSLEAMAPGGVATISTYCHDGKVVLRVSDTGPGIPPELVGKLGTPFFTTKENGTGLGLAVCYRIAERHNAQIGVESSAQGTTFTVTFNHEQD